MKDSNISEIRKKLWDLMAQEHGKSLLESEIDEIIYIVNPKLHFSHKHKARTTPIREK